MHRIAVASGRPSSIFAQTVLTIGAICGWKGTDEAMTPQMHLAAIIASFSGHPDREHIVYDLHRAYALGHEFGRDRAADVVDRCNREGPYNAIGAAKRIRALLVSVPGTPHTIAGEDL